MLENYEKPPLTFEDQVSKLIERGLVVDDKEQAKKILSTISYYRLRAYWYPFRIKDKEGEITNQFRDNVNFNDIISLYEFDRHLRLLFIDAIERIEVAVRTHISYILSHEYGIFAHSDPNNFHPKFDHNYRIEKVEKEMTSKERKKEESIQHYKNKYDGFPKVPIWMLVEWMTLGDLSKLFYGMKNNDKRSIAEKFGRTHQQMKDELHLLTYVRNICTHHGRLWNRKLATKAGVPKQAVWRPRMTPTNERVFFVLLIIRTMLKVLEIGENWESDATELIKPVVENPLWRNAMGFPEDWEEHPLWID